MKLNAPFAVLLAFSMGGTLGATTLAELTARLRGFDGREPIAAELVREMSNGDNHGPARKDPGVAVHVRVTADASEIGIHWNRDQLLDARPPAAGDESPAQKVIDSVTATTVTDYLNGGPALLRKLDGAELVLEDDGDLEGRPAHHLKFKLNPPLSEHDRKYIREIEASADLWLDETGTPLAAKSKVRVKGRALLLITFESTQRDDYRFKLVKNRLLVVEHVQENAGSGGGESGSQKMVTRLSF